MANKSARLASSYAPKGDGIHAYNDACAAAKEQFLKDGMKLLRSVRTVLGASGFTVVVKKNPAGPAVSGEVYAYISRGDLPLMLFVQVGASPQLGRGTDGAYILVQHREKGRIVGANLFLDANLYDSHTLSAKLYRLLTGRDIG